MSIIGLKKADCKNCYKCIKVCPVKSIKVVNGQAEIIDDDCILCGSCLSECPQNAKIFFSDIDKVKNMITDNKKVVVSMAPSYIGAFDFDSSGRLVSAIKKLGFFGVSETSEGASYVSAEYYRLAKEGKMNNIITTCCPVVNNLVEKYYPDVIPNMAPVITPMIAHGKILKQKFGSDTKVVFVGPCIAKKDEMLDIRHNSQIDAVLTFDDIINWLGEKNIDIMSCDVDKFCNHNTMITKLYPVSGGILTTLDKLGKIEGYNTLCVDGIDEVKELLEAVEKGLINKCIIEINSCKGGCINGPSKGHNNKSKFKTKLDLENKVRDNNYGFPIIHNEVMMNKRFINRSSREPLPTEEEIREILAKVGKISPEQELNCGLCGYPSCRDKAIAVFQKKAELTMCIPFMRQRAESLSNVVLAQTPNITILVDEDFNIVEFNNAAEKKFDITRSQALQMGLYEIMDTNEVAEVFANKKSIYDKKVTFENYKFVAVESLIYIQEENLVMGIFNDITQEEEEKAKKYKLTVDTVDMAQKVIEKQMTVAQEIAGLLGETTAETKVTLTKLKKMMLNEK